MAKGFAKALSSMKERGMWINTRHLYCRWHIYEAIKRHCKPMFAAMPKGMGFQELNRYFS